MKILIALLLAVNIAYAEDERCIQYENKDVVVLEYAKPCTFKASEFQLSKVNHVEQLHRAYAKDKDGIYEACFEDQVNNIVILPLAEPRYIRQFNPASFHECKDL